MAQSPQLKQSSPTSPDPQDFRLDATPAMRADNVVSGEHWRIGLITDSLVRFEWSDSGVFENRPTQTVLNRDFGSPVERRVTERDGRVIIDTAALTIVYDQQPFSKEGLSVVVKGVADTQFNTWHYGDAQRGNLKGTARTLDEADGAIELDNGVISRDGWAVIDDSAANIIIETDTVNGKANPFGTWVSPRATAETDLYFFGYGHRYIEAVRDFYRLTGPTPLLPRFAMGNWWSRYYRYTQDGYLALMDRFKREGIPFTTSVIDMDWHRVDDVDPKYGSGWTGYSWNRELFPDPPAFLADLHRRGLLFLLVSSAFLRGSALFAVLYSFVLTSLYVINNLFSDKFRIYGRNRFRQFFARHPVYTAQREAPIQNNLLCVHSPDAARSTY